MAARNALDPKTPSMSTGMRQPERASENSSPKTAFFTFFLFALPCYHLALQSD
jgi:hypothetical protein